MPISLSAKKSLRKSIKNRKSNFLAKKNFKLATKEYLVKPTQEGLNNIFSLLDKLVKVNIFHKNKTARLKAKYARALAGIFNANVIKKKTTNVKKKAVQKSIAAKRKVAKKM